MSNFKSGSGDLDFGSDEDSEEQPDAPESMDPAEQEGDAPSQAGEQSTGSSEHPASETDAADPGIDEPTTTPETTSETSTEQYPYFVRRSNVGDERGTRLEIHVRDKVADGEPAFRSQLAELLDVNEVAKTDAREFALLAAFKDPERVAKLMEEEGFGYR